MILSSTPPLLASGGALLLVGVTVLLYGLAAWPATWLRRFAMAALLGAFALHALLLLIDIGGLGQSLHGARLGFGPVLSMAVWLVIAVYIVESRMLPLPAVRQWLGWTGLVGVLLAAAFPGLVKQGISPLSSLHFALGVASYGLFGSAVLHGLMLDRAERRLRAGFAARPAEGAEPGQPPPRPLGMPLLRLERLTFRFVAAGFVVLSATLGLGFLTATRWHADHKIVFGLLAWCVFAALLVGRRWRGWRGRHATRWLYAGALLLLLAYAGSRFVMEVLIGR